MPAPASNRRALVLLVVLLIVAVAAMIGTTAVAMTLTQRSELASAQRRTQARLLALTGLTSVMAQLERQRDAMLKGEIPDLTTEATVYTDSGGDGVQRRGLWRIIKRKTPDGKELPCEPEAGKLDVNFATPAMLNSAGLSEAGAAAAVAARGKRRLLSLAELRALPEFNSAASAANPSRFTVFSADAAAPSSALRPADQPQRLRIDHAWSEDFEKEATAALGPDLTAKLKDMIGPAKGILTDADLVTGAHTRQLTPKQIATLVDTCATGGDDAGIRLGRVDLNLAPIEVLAAIPGFTAESAAKVVQKRSTLPVDQARSTAWPLTEGIIAVEDFAKAADWLTTRCLQWRVVIEAGVLITESTGSGTTASAEQDDTLRNRVVIEAVIDLAAEKVRVAELVDITRVDAARSAERATTEAAAAKPDPKPKPAPDALKPPSEGLKPPSEGLKPPSEGLKPPSEGLKPPSEGLKAPSDRPADPAAPPPEPARPPQPKRVGRWTTGG